MTADIVLRAGDDRPVLRRTLRGPNGEPIDLSAGGTSVKIQVTDPITGSLEIDQAATVQDAANGVVDYDWDNGVPAEGVYFVYYEITVGTTVMSVPNSTPLSLLVTGTSSWEYSYTNDPGSREIDAVRFFTHDTDTSKAILTDKEIQFLIDEDGNKYTAAADAAFMMAGFYSSLLDKTVGPLSIKYGQTANRMMELARSLQQRAAQKASVRPVNGASKSSKPIFEIGMNDYPASLLPPWQSNDQQPANEIT